MMKVKLGAFALSLFLLLAAAGPCPAAQVYVHYFVVPTQTADGPDPVTALHNFKTELAKLAGGYTELGRSNGAVWTGNRLETEFSISFLVSAPTKLTTEIKALISKYFTQISSPFLLVWTAEAE